MIEVPDGNKCYSNDFYYYNIKCNTWVSASHINSTSSPPLINYPPRAGRFSHTAVMRDHQTMIIIAGFNGVMYGDILAYRFPQAVVLKNSNNLVETGGHCNAFQEKSKNSTICCIRAVSLLILFNDMSTVVAFVSDLRIVLYFCL